MTVLPRKPGEKKPRRGLGGLATLLAFVVLSAAGIFVFWYLPRARAEQIDAWSRDLTVRADLRYEALSRFFEDGNSGARTIAGYPSVEAALGREGSPETHSHVAALLENFGRSEGFLAATIVDLEARPVVGSSGVTPDAGCAAAARGVLESGKPAIGLHRHEGLGPLLTYGAPVRSPDGSIRGAAVVYADPAQWLYPFLARPLAGTDTGEAALVARDGNDAVLLSPLRDRPGATLALRWPLGSLGLGAKAAFEGFGGVLSLTDYRARRVLVTGRRLPPSPWAMVMRMDEAEVLKAYHENARRSAAALTAFLLAACALVWGLVQRRERLQQAVLSAERRLQDEAIRESEERYRALFDGMRNGVAYCEMVSEEGQPPDYVNLVVNRAFGELTGLKDVVGRRISEIIPGIQEQNRDLLDGYARVAETGRPETFEAFVPALDAWYTISAYSPRKGQFVAVFDNVTERKKAEEALLETQKQLAQSQKMEAVGRLAGGIAHDFNNLLTVIRGYGELLAADLEDETKREEVGEILKAAERASGLTSQLLAFSRRQTFEIQTLDLGSVVADTEKMLKRLIGEDIHLTVACPARLASVRADRGQVEQVLLNLAVNARDAMPRGGPLRISLAETTTETALPSADGGIPPGAYVVLTVSDAGCGMSRETLEHAFEPFFTTKETGKGTGLGLATVFGIVKQSGGHIRVASAPGSGTTFDLFFPRVDGPQAGPLPADAEKRGGSETILVAEDEPAVRALAVRMLSGHGYRVLSAAGGDEALAQAEAAGALDLLLTDLVMPGMSGFELAQRLSVRRPGLRVLFMSGYSHDVLSRFGGSVSDVPLLRKPFTAEELARQVRETLDGPAPVGLADLPRTGPPSPVVPS